MEKSPFIVFLMLVIYSYSTLAYATDDKDIFVEPSAMRFKQIDVKKMHARLKNMTPEERQQLVDNMKNLTPQEKRDVAQRIQEIVEAEETEE